MTLDDFLAKVSGPKLKDSTGVFVICPTHNDTNPSCHVKNGDRSLMFYCHANKNCTHAGIKAAFEEAGILPKWQPKTKQRPREERDAATLISPVPDDAPPCSAWMLGDQHWAYRDGFSRLLGYVKRYEAATGKKFTQVTYARFADGKREWTYKDFTQPYPLYGLDRLASNATAPVISVEGEKAADALQKILTGYVVVSPMHGAKSFKHADWTPLYGREVTFWPDADEAGRDAVAVAVKALEGHTLPRVLSVADLPEKFDAFDAVAAWNVEQILSFITTGILPEDIERRAVNIADVILDPKAPVEVEVTPRKGGWMRTGDGSEYRGLKGTIFNEYRKPSDFIQRVGENKREAKYVGMTNFRMYIAADLVIDKGNGPDYEERTYEIALHQSGTIRTARVTPSEFVSGLTAWAHKAFGPSIVVTAGEERRVVQAIGAASIIEGFAQRRTYAFTGWHRIEGKWLYLFHGGAMGAEGIDRSVLVELPVSLRHFQLVDPLAGDDLRNAIRREIAFVRLFPPVTVPIVCAIWRAALRPTRYVLQVTGETGSFKTMIALVAQRHTGTGWSEASLPMDWVSTLASLEIPANTLRYTIGVIDNYHPSKISPKKKADYKAKGEEFLAFLASKHAHERSLWKSGLKTAEPLPPHVLGISTGEETIGAPGDSTRARSSLLDICRADLADSQTGRTAMAAVTQDSENGVFVGLYSAYIKWLAEESRFESIGAQLPEQELRLRNKYQSEGMHRRAPDIVASQMMGFSVFRSFAEYYCPGEITDKDLELVKRTLLANAEAAATSAQEADFVDRYAQLLASAIQSGRAHLVSMATGGEPRDCINYGWRERPQTPRHDKDGNTCPVDTVYESHGDRVGWIDEDDGTFWIDADKAWELVEQQSRADNGLGISKDDLHKRLLRADRLASVRYRNAKDKTPYPLVQKKGLPGAVGRTSGLLHLKSTFFDADHRVEVDLAIQELEALIEIDSEVLADPENPKGEWAVECATSIARMEDWRNKLKAGEIDTAFAEMKEFYSQFINTVDREAE